MLDHKSSAVLDQKSTKLRARNDMGYMKTTAVGCEWQSEGSLKRKGWSKSQSGEDLILYRWFNKMCGGKYIEMGALDGVEYSNSYLFEAALDWNGLLVEVTPPSFEKLRENRPYNALVHAGVCEKRQKVHYYDGGGKYKPPYQISEAFWNKLTVFMSLLGSAVAGIVEFSAESFRNRWWPKLKDDLSNAHEIDCYPLQDIIQEQFDSVAIEDGYHFDFFSLDVEGAEFQVLKSIDFNQVSFGVIVLEADEHNERKNLSIRVFLEARGYIFLESAQRSYWFVHHEFDKIYGHLTL